MSDGRPAVMTMTMTMAAAAAVAAGCSNVEPTPSSPPTTSTTACSQVHRALARWKGSEVESRECGADLTDAVELVPLGHGGLLARHRFSPPDERWDLADDGTVRKTTTMNAIIEWESAAFSLMPPYAGTDQASPALLVFDPHSPVWSLTRTGVDRLMAESSGVWPQIPGAPPPWDYAKPGGRQLIGLADDLALDRSLGDGRVRFWRFVRDANGAQTAVPVAGVEGGVRDDFRRGHRLVPLGPGRLLEWLPVSCDGPTATAPSAACARFNVWTYVTAPDAATTGTVDPFSTAPASSGLWTDVGEGEDILTDEAHVFVWTRETGQLRIYRLDQTAADPLNPTLSMGSSQQLAALSSVNWKPPTRATPLQHLLIILQDGRSFDTYFGRHCQGAPGPDGAPPACEEGAACCEGLPLAMAESCVPLDPSAPPSHRPNDSPACMRAKMNAGAMDGFASAHGNGCGDPGDVVCAGDGTAAGALATYHALAAGGALADRFFQSYAFVEGDGDPDGQGPMASETDPATQNLLYLTAARFGDPFSFDGTPQVEQDLSRMEVGWAIYVGPEKRAFLRRFDMAVFHNPLFDAYRAVDGGELESDLRTGQLPPVAVVVPDAGDPGRGEGPGHPLDAPIKFVAGLVDAVAQSRYRDDTLVLITYLTAGGHYDHVRPPPSPPLNVDATLDGQRAIFYGPRVPLLALGRFARRNHVSHVPLELSSVAAFIEWNWLSGRTTKDDRARTDQRGYRDEWVNGLGSLLDPALQVPAGPP